MGNNLPFRGQIVRSTHSMRPSFFILCSEVSVCLDRTHLAGYKAFDVSRRLCPMSLMWASHSRIRALSLVPDSSLVTRLDISEAIAMDPLPKSLSVETDCAESLDDEVHLARRYQVLLVLSGFFMIFQVNGINSIFGVFQVSTQCCHGGFLAHFTNDLPTRSFIPRTQATYRRPEGKMRLCLLLAL